MNNKIALRILGKGDVPSDILASRKVGIPLVAAAWAKLPSRKNYNS